MQGFAVEAVDGPTTYGFLFVMAPVPSKCNPEALSEELDLGLGLKPLNSQQPQVEV